MVANNGNSFFSSLLSNFYFVRAQRIDCGKREQLYAIFGREDFQEGIELQGLSELFLHMRFRSNAPFCLRIERS